MGALLVHLLPEERRHDDGAVAACIWIGLVGERIIQSAEKWLRTPTVGYR